MSDTVKLIIEIPKGVYEMCKDLWFYDAKTLEGAVAKGTPLEDIKAEIQASMYCDKDTRLVENANASGLKKALEIIDKHIIGEGDK